ncbi:MAG: hypothetical protein KAV00_00505 [Phycisphaerae bacterium]|nr:hypothetical protein [Phycisphaerae bacterium]
MNGIIKKLERLTEEQLYTISAAIDDRLERLGERRIKRGYQRSTYISDLVRGRRCAPHEIRKAA